MFNVQNEARELWNLINIFFSVLIEMEMKQQNLENCYGMTVVAVLKKF